MTLRLLCQSCGWTSPTQKTAIPNHFTCPKCNGRVVFALAKEALSG